jgi:hypothetical protein
MGVLNINGFGFTSRLVSYLFATKVSVMSLTFLGAAEIATTGLPIVKVELTVLKLVVDVTVALLELHTDDVDEIVLVEPKRFDGVATFFFRISIIFAIRS